MAAGIKFDDGSGGFASNCFPVRPFIRQNEEAGGAWLIAQRAEQRKRFKALLCSKPRTFEEIRNVRIQSEKDGTSIVPPSKELDEEDNDSQTLDGFFLMKHCCVEDPSDLCSVNISGQGLSEVKKEDFLLFDNVAYVNAAENILPLECFNSFPIVRELELPLNGLRGIKLSSRDFASLELLDLSFNNLSHQDLLALGLLRNLRILHLTGNSLTSLPPDLARPHLEEEDGSRIERFPKLEILLLDDNRLADLTTFATLAGLRNLKQLNLSKNHISSVPQLMLVEGRHVTQIEESRPNTAVENQQSTPKHSARRSRRSNRSSPDKIKSGRKSNKKLDTTPEPTPVSTEGKTQESRKSAEVPADALMEDFGELDLEKLDSKLSEDQVSPAEPVKDKQSRKLETDPSLPPPFPELRHLNLSHNYIYEEEGLLAVAAWPMLTELIIHNNPLTTEHRGDPPILTRFLHQRLGVNIQRTKPRPLEKPHIEVDLKSERQVKTKILPVPRCDVDKLLAIEPPAKPSPAIEPPTPDKTNTQSSFTGGKLLPPITPTPESSMESPDKLTEEKDGFHGNSDEESDEEQYDQFNGDAFFMTQVDDVGSKKSRPTSEEGKSATPEVKEVKQGKRRETVDGKLAGYEILLSDEEDERYDPDLPLPKDIHGNVRALKYALNHPLVFRENKVELDKRQKVFKPHIKNRPPVGTIKKPKHEKVEEALDNLKTRKTVDEAPLLDVLKKEDKKMGKRFPGADQLLGEVQHRYNAVRATSMKNARQRQLSEMKEILSDTVKDIQMKC